MLSMISEIYNPLGLATPLLLKEKQILQDLCRNNYNQDDKVPDVYTAN